MLAELLGAALSYIGDEVYFKQEIERCFDGTTVLQSFERLLLAHNISSEVISGIINDPETLLLGKQLRVPIVSRVSGRLMSIDQKALGLFVNFTLFTGLTDFVRRKERNGAGLVLHMRLHNKVCIGMPLCTLVVHEQYFQQNEQAITETLLNCFNIV